MTPLEKRLFREHFFDGHSLGFIDGFNPRCFGCQHARAVRRNQMRGAAEFLRNAFTDVTAPDGSKI